MGKAIQRQFPQGEHVCALYDRSVNQYAIAAEYIADGLWAGDRCLYSAESAVHAEAFRRALAAVGIDVPRGERIGALLVVTSADTHLAGGRFDGERMLKMLNDAIEAALNDSYLGLRTCGDMSWLLDHPDGVGRAMEYEALLNQLFLGARASGMCQYDHARLPAPVIGQALATHPFVVAEGTFMSNPFFSTRPPDSGTTHTDADVSRKIRQLRRR